MLNQAPNLDGSNWPNLLKTDQIQFVPRIQIQVELKSH